MPLQLMLLHVLIHGKRQKMSRVKAENYTYPCKRPIWIMFKIYTYSEAWWDKKEMFSYLSQAI